MGKIHFMQYIQSLVQQIVNILINIITLHIVGFISVCQQFYTETKI